MSEKHTPGPWEQGRFEWDIQTDMDDPIGQADAQNPAWRANARLIAAAPDLLAACEALPLDSEFVDAADFKDNAAAFLKAMRLARAAVARARGE